MDLAYICEWEKWPKSTHCPSVPLACTWSCRNLIAFTTDLRSDDQGAPAVPPHPRLPQGLLLQDEGWRGAQRAWSRGRWEHPVRWPGPGVGGPMQLAEAPA